MVKSIKKAMATLAALTLFVSSAAPVFAQTFNDVPTNAWYYEYVEQLVDEGVFDVSDNFRPGDPLNRAELVKIVITAIDGLFDYEAPATPTFDDVSVDAWYYDYIEAGVQLGIVSGYTDAAGNLTGMFGPGDTVNRAAATKILVNAFAVPTTLTPGSMFPDVPSSAWFHDYVVTAYNQSILDGYNDGRFGPADPVTRAQVAKLTVNAQDPMEREEMVEEDDEEEDVVVGEGALEVSLNDDTAPSSTVPQRASNVQVASFDFTAADDDVEVTNVVVTRGGVGQTADWDALYLYDGASRLTTGRTINNDTNTATFPVSLLVEAGTTKTLSVVGDVAAAPGASNQHYFYVASVADVTSNAQDVVGDFPVAGNTFTMGGTATVVNGLTLAPGTAPSQPQIGSTDAEIASVRMTAGATNDIAIHGLTLTQGGSLSSAKMVNCRLLRGTDEVATAEGFDGDRVVFTLDTPYVIPEGQTKTFYQRCDIDGGRTTDTVSLYLDESTDVVAIDQQYGYGGVITNNFTSALANTITLKGGDVTVTDNGPAAVQIAQNSTNNELLNFSITTDRDLTVRNTFIQLNIQDTTGTGPELGAAGATLASTTTVADGGGASLEDSSDFCVANGTANITQGDMLQIAAASGTVYGRVLAYSAADGACVGGNDRVTTNLAVGDAVANGNQITEVDPYDYVRNLRLVDLDSGSTLAGPLTDANSGATFVNSAGAVSSDSWSRVHTEDYELTGGDSRHMSIQADINQDLPAGYQINAQVRYSTGAGNSYLKDLDANEFVAATEVVGAGTQVLAGKWMTSAANSLAVARASTPTSQTYVKGDDSVPALGVAMTAGDAGDITVKRLIVRVYGDTANDGAGFSATGLIAANTYVSSVTLYDGDDVVAGPEGLSGVLGAGASTTAFDGDADYYRAQFDDLNLVVEQGSTKTLTAKVNLLNTMAGPVYVAVDVLPNADIIAEDADANTVTASGAQLNNTADNHTPIITINNSGTLTASSEGNPNSANLAAGATQQLVSKYRFTALREDYDVNKITLVNEVTAGADFDGTAGTADATAAISQVTVKYPDVNGVTQSKTAALSGGTATLSGLGFYVPAGEDVFLEVYADVNSMASVGETLSGQTFRLGLQNDNNSTSTFEAVGSSSSVTENFDEADPTARVANTASVNPFVVRKTVPTFTKASGSTNLINGENTFYGVTVAADAAGSVSLGRLIFDMTTSELDDATEDIYGFRFYRGSTPIATTDVNIYAVNATPNNPIDVQAAATAGAGLEDADDTAGDNLIANATYKIIVSFDQEETVSAGGSQTYYLKATVSGADTNDSVTTKLATGDEATAITGMVAAGNNGNANTGQMYSTTLDAGLFDTNTDAGQCDASSATASTDFRALVGDQAKCNLIWSDKSADAHLYPTVGAGDVTDNSGSYDWTNGYLLKITDLTSQTLTN